MNECKHDSCNSLVRARGLCSKHWNYEQYGKCKNECNQPAANSKGFCHNCIKRNGKAPSTRRDGTCSKCGNTLNYDLRCSICRKIEQKNNNLKRRYGITIDQWNLILSKQNNVCKICKRDSKRFVVDHNHLCCPEIKTCGECIRGIICENCNRAIGLVDDSAEILYNMIKYLKDIS